LQKQGISGLLNICTTIKHCAIFELLCLEALPSQSPKPLCASSSHSKVHPISACLLGDIAIHELEGVDDPLHDGSVHGLLMLLEC
jgi:hypothetical protein